MPFSFVWTFNVLGLSSDQHISGGSRTIQFEINRVSASAQSELVPAAHTPPPSTHYGIRDAHYATNAISVIRRDNTTRAGWLRRLVTNRMRDRSHQLA